MNAPMREVATPLVFHGGKIVLHPGDCMKVLATLADNSVDAVVTDPPYHLTSIVKRFGSPTAAPAMSAAQRRFAKTGGADRKPGTDQYGRLSKGFMGKVWDGGDIAFTPELWAEVLRVLKPGGHMVAFSGTRTYHRMACAIEDAGFEIRDQILFAHETKGEIDAFINSLNDEQRSQFGKLFYERGHGQLFWAFGSGFPKSHNVSRNLDAERCMCSMQHRSEIQASVSTGAVLQSEMRGSGEAHIADDEDLPDLRHAMDANRSISGGERQDVLSGLRGGEDSGIQERHDPQTPHRLRDVQRNSQRPASVEAAETGQSLLQPLMPSQGPCRSSGPIQSERIGEKAAGNRNERSHEPGMEGRGDISQEARELCERPLCAMPAASDFDGESGRVCNGASKSNGRMDWPAAHANRMRASQGPQAAQQSAKQSGTVAGQPEPQERRAWDHCERCGKPIVPDGLGTALKPAHEPICLARKPLSEPTVLANVLRWGTGAINVDACRVTHSSEADRASATPGGRTTAKSGALAGKVQHAGGRTEFSRPDTSKGRFPANLLHDGSPEVLAGFPETAPSKQSAATARSNGVMKYGGENSRPSHGTTVRHSENEGFTDSGSAARFFYTAKADAEDRLGSKHPTVKPVDLMQWLVRLICPKGGTVLDPFAGTGTTGAAAFIEGCRAVLIEREAEYQADIARRMELLLSGPDERSRKLTAPEPAHNLPLFTKRNGVPAS